MRQWSVHSRPSRYTHSVIACDKREAFALGAKRRSNPACCSKLDCFAALAMTGPGAFSQITCPALCAKISCFLSDAKHFPNGAVSSHRGALAIVTDAGRDAMDAIVSTADERC